MSELSSSQIQAQLEGVLASTTFANVDRLRAFLSYVVQESLSGHAHRIVGKRIAQDVYGRGPDEGSDSIVRVDAGRLRRKLTEYHAGEGANDPIRIHIDSGGYAPRFEDLAVVLEPDKKTQGTLPSPRGDLPLLLIAPLVLILVGVAWALMNKDAPSTTEAPTLNNATQNQLERTILAEKSTATLQAANLAEQASGLLFPIADPGHQKLATSMFKEAIRIDPNFADGYAGAAHSTATLAILARSSEDRASQLGEAASLAEKAIFLDPLSGWCQSASAWVAFANGNYDEALNLSKRAVSLDGMDGKVLDFHSVILSLTGRFEDALAISNPENSRNNKNRHPAHLNLYGVANFHLGHYETALTSFDAAVMQGGPVSALTLMYKAASRQALGDSSTAKVLLDNMQATWPSFNPEAALKQFYQHPENAEQILVLLREVGLRN